MEKNDTELASTSLRTCRAHSVRLPMFALTKIVIWLNNPLNIEFVLKVFGLLQAAVGKRQDELRFSETKNAPAVYVYTPSGAFCS